MIRMEFLIAICVTRVNRVSKSYDKEESVYDHAHLSTWLIIQTHSDSPREEESHPAAGRVVAVPHVRANGMSGQIESAFSNECLRNNLEFSC